MVKTSGAKNLSATHPCGCFLTLQFLGQEKTRLQDSVHQLVSSTAVSEGSRVTTNEATPPFILFCGETFDIFLRESLVRWC